MPNRQPSGPAIPVGLLSQNGRNGLVTSLLRKRIFFLHTACASLRIERTEDLSKVYVVDGTTLVQRSEPSAKEPSIVTMTTTRRSKAGTIVSDLNAVAYESKLPSSEQVDSVKGRNTTRSLLSATKVREEDGGVHRAVRKGFKNREVSRSSPWTPAILRVTAMCVLR